MTDPIVPDEDPFDLDKYRLRQDFARDSGVKKQLTMVPVRKPSRWEFVRVHPDPAWSADSVAIITTPESRESYLVSSPLAEELGPDVRHVALYTTITRQATVLLWPVGLSADGRSNPWHESALQAVYGARQRWLRIVANMELGAYDQFLADPGLSDPEWPRVTFRHLLGVAFKGHLIDDRSHPILRRLRGEV